MKIDIQYDNKHITKSELEYSVKWFLTNLLRKKADNLHIIIKSIENEKENIFASTLILDKFKFQIELHSKIKNRACHISSLAHECVHIKQILTKELTLYEKTFIWKGKKHRYNSFEYYELPFEIDAHGREIGLYFTYRSHIQREKKFDADQLWKQKIF